VTQPIVWGVADDASKFADDGGAWFYGQMQGASLTTNRWTLAWDSTAPTEIKELPFLERAAPKAQAAGIHVLLSLYAGSPSPTATQHDAVGHSRLHRLERAEHPALLVTAERRRRQRRGSAGV
jgi:hypothetical protein